MSTFNEREQGFEKKFAHDEELQFKATARRNKLLGLWVAEHLGKSGEAADSYAIEVIKADLEEPGDEDVFRKIRGDLDASGSDVSDHLLRKQISELMGTAIAQIESEK